MEILKSAILGIIQGLTEFLPVSSSGHMVIIPFLFKWDYSPLYLTVILHFGTLLSLITVFYKDIWLIIKNFFKGIFIRSYRKDKYFKLAVYIIIASIPAAIAGFLFEKHIEELFSKPLYVAIFLLITALLLFTSEFFGKKLEAKIQTNKESSNNTDNVNDGRLNFYNTFIIGIGQAIAILPGISRSGATISFGRYFGIKRDECVKFSFLLSIPVIFGAFIFEIYDSFSVIAQQPASGIINIIAGFIFSFLSGLFAIKFMLILSRKRNLNFFALYCFVISVIVFIFIVMRGI